MRADAVVIGAGVSGLACARRLHDAGLDITVCEARDRIGGRVHTFRPADGGPALELGAQVIHGDQNPVRALRLKLRPVPRDGQASVVLGGQIYPMGILARADAAPWVLEARLAADGTTDMPVAAWLDRALGGAATPVTMLAAAEWFRQNWAGDPADLSAAGVAAGLRADAAVGAREFLPVDGYATVPAALAAGMEIRTGCPVDEVSWSNGRAEARAQVQGDALHVMARAVVVTVPPRVVAEGRLAMPALPLRKQDAIKALRPGDGCCAVATVSRAAPESAVVFDADGVSGFVRCAQGRPEVLIVAKAGAAASVRAAVTGTGASPGALAELLGRTLPWTRGAPVAATRICDWGGDPWSGGAFTFPRAGALWAHAAWAEPVADTVFFAGEATCSRPARVHGAINSGVRAADQVLEVLGR